jgi:acyl carrier protein
MNEPEIRKQVRDFIVNNCLDDLDPSELNDDSSFESLHIIDSVRALDVILFVEEAFGFTVENDEALPENFDSIDNIVDYVQSKRPTIA